MFKKNGSAFFNGSNLIPSLSANRVTLLVHNQKTQDRFRPPRRPLELEKKKTNTNSLYLRKKKLTFAGFETLPLAKRHSNIRTDSLAPVHNHTVSLA